LVGRLAMMGELTFQNCGLYGPIVHPRAICNVDYDMVILTKANSQLVYQSALAATSTVRWSCHPRHLWSEWESGRSKWEFSLSVRWDFKRYFTCRKILRRGTSGFTSHPKEGVLRTFIALTNPSPWPGSNPQPLRPVASTLSTTPPRRRGLVGLHVWLWYIPSDLWLPVTMFGNCLVDWWRDIRWSFFHTSMQ
jgi:hypothetical protein